MSRVIATVLVPGGSVVKMDVGPPPPPDVLRVWYQGLPCRVMGLHLDSRDSNSEFEPAP